MAFSKIVSKSFEAYFANIKLLLLFSIPFLIAFPLALLLPNYTALSGIYLRLGSLGADVSMLETALMIGVVLVSLLVFSFALVAVNSVVKAQRAFLRLKHADFERMEEATFKLFAVLLVAFLAAFAFNLLLYETKVVSEPARLVLNSLFAALVSLLVLFAPQAIVIDNASPEHAFMLNASILSRRTGAVLLFILLGALLVALNAAVFASLHSSLSFAPLVGIVVNSLLIIPFLEVVKSQIYLSKYNLL